MNSLVILALCVTAFSLTLAWVFFRSPGYFKTKLLLSLVLVYLSTAVAFSFSSFMGYATSDHIPVGSRLIQASVKRPQGPIPGAIYVWVQAPFQDFVWSLLKPFGYRSNGDEPRSYSLPYSEEMADKMEEANEAMKSGAEVRFGKPGKGKPGSGDPGTGEESDEQSGKNPGKYRQSSDEPYDAPDILIQDPYERMPK